MVKVRKDLTGWKHPNGRLTVLWRIEDYVHNGKSYPVWHCKCDCGNECDVIGYHLTSKTRPTLSCGCLHKEKTSQAKKKYNHYDLSGEFGRGWTTNTNREFWFELKHYELIKDICWVESHRQDDTHILEGRNPKTSKNIRMHILLGYKGYDHIDRNELNNLESNLRPCTKQENNRNKSKQKNNKSGVSGVCWDDWIGKWKVYIRVNDKPKHLGRFDDKNEAIITRLKAEKKYYGEFAPQQHLYEQYGI